MLWFLRNVARNSPTRISNIEITPLEFCGFLDTYEKLGYPNYVRVLVDEAPQANSCVRSSSHDTAHDPRDASNTTPTPHNAKSRISVRAGWHDQRPDNKRGRDRITRPRPRRAGALLHAHLAIEVRGLYAVRAPNHLQRPGGSTQRPPLKGVHVFALNLD